MFTRISESTSCWKLLGAGPSHSNLGQCWDSEPHTHTRTERERERERECMRVCVCVCVFVCVCVWCLVRVVICLGSGEAEDARERVDANQSKMYHTKYMIEVTVCLGRVRPGTRYISSLVHHSMSSRTVRVTVSPIMFFNWVKACQCAASEREA